MSIKVMLIGRLGNNLFQYALGRIIAEHHGWALGCRPYPVARLMLYGALDHNAGLDQGTAGANLLSAAVHFPNAPLQLEGAEHLDPVETFQLDRDGWNGQQIDLNAILADDRPRQIRLAGYFQRQDYYVPHRDRIRRWFKTDANLDLPAIGDQDVLLNIRGGSDFEHLGWKISTDYYLAALKGMERIGRIFVCGVGIDERARQALEPLAPIYFTGPPIAHFEFIQRFRRMVLPNSTFSWWAGFLSYAEEICVPALGSSAGFSFHGGGVDLVLCDPSYRQVACEFT